MASNDLISRIISEKNLEVSFVPEFADLLQQSQITKVAILATCEYEGIFRNGGVGTHYKTLSEHLTRDGWYVILLICHTEEAYGGKSNIPAVKHIFSTGEISKFLNLQPIHQLALSVVKHDGFDRESYPCFLFTQAVSSFCSQAQVYVEFHEMAGIGYHTIQAKRSHTLGENCITAVTMHSGHEWVYEANGWYAEFYHQWFKQVCDYEQYTFENADLAFFPSYHLKSRVESYGWKTDHAKHMPYFIPVIPNSDAFQLVGMTSPEERQYVQDYARDAYTGQGQIVDLGCWLGSLTVPLAIGLQDNPNPPALGCVHAYDLFEWAEWMNVCVEYTPLRGKYKEGDNFLQEFLDQTKPWKDLIKVYPGDLNQMVWQPDQSIEFLMIDAMKSWELLNSIVRIFFPALVPGLSLVSHQDFCHYFTVWIHLVMYRFKDYFEPICYVPEQTFVFKYLKPLPAEWMSKSYGFEDFSETEMAAAFDYSLSITPAQGKPNVAAAKAMLYFHLGDADQARLEIKRAKEQGWWSAKSDFRHLGKM